MGPKRFPPDNSSINDESNNNSGMTLEIPSNDNINGIIIENNNDEYYNTTNNVDTNSNHPNSPDRYSIESITFHRSGYMEVTPRGNEREIYKYFCPICFLYYKKSCYF
jgi:hypothetical protein